MKQMTRRSGFTATTSTRTDGGQPGALGREAHPTDGGEGSAPPAAGGRLGTADHPDRAESATGDLIVGLAAANQSASPRVLLCVRAELGSEGDSDRRAFEETRGLRALSSGCLRPGLTKQMTEG
jgi:hypothetical protein